MPFTRDIKEKISKVSCGNHSAAVTTEGELFLWGTGSFGTYLIPRKIEFQDNLIIDVEVGGCFGIALDADGGVFSWGTNTSGELGLGDFDPRNKPIKIDFLKTQVIKKIFCGTNFSIALGEPRVSFSSQKEITRKFHEYTEGNTVLQSPKSPVFAEQLTESPLNHPTIKSLITTLRQERDFLQSCLKEERAEKTKIESELSAVKDQYISSTVEIERLSNELDKNNSLLKEAMQNEEISKDKEVLYKNLLESHENIAEENKRLFQLIHEYEIKSQSDVMDLELARKDVASLIQQ